MKLATPAGLFLLLSTTWAAAAEPGVDYLREVKPILRARCASCHGALRQKAGLRLDTAELARAGGKGGPAIVPGDAEGSELLDRVVAAEDAGRMPPASEGVALSIAEVETLRRWVDQGAAAPPEPTPSDPREHWAYRPPTRPPVPDLGPEWAGNPIDAFLEEARRRKGLVAAGPAPRDVWLRRVAIDLAGLPPTPEERQAFLADASPGAEERAVDRLLATPAHGERWARHWMDIWRYSDWYGLGEEIRYSHPHIWRWRDWIVESLNRDKGYDRMVVEMLAGDEVAPGDPDTVRATGFLVRNWDIFNRNAWLGNTVEHTARSFLGLTLQCAKCHDHKYDPIAQADYYRFRAFFEPYHVRIDRVPGQPNRAKDGLSRVFDDFLDAPTYLFRRGDEANPVKDRPLAAGTPLVLGGRELEIRSVPLPVSAHTPDRREFVIREAIEADEKAAVEASASLASAAQGFDVAPQELAAAEDADRKSRAATAAAATPEARATSLIAASAAAERLARARHAIAPTTATRDLAEATGRLAEARRAARLALVAVERLEDEGARDVAADIWEASAQATVDAQRRLALAEADRARLVARQAEAQAAAALDANVAVAVDPKNAATQTAVSLAAAALAKARAGRDEAEGKFAQAEVEVSKPLTASYTPRPLEFPRAKTSYRDTPGNAPFSQVSTGRRLALARWIADGRNPLTARVAVNHVWARHFGEPLVPSVDDFGLRAPRPEHLALLDWLATEFVDSAWSLKRLHRLIVTSKAYRMRSAADRADDPGATIDPDNRLLWRMNVRRMEGEAIRDGLLSLSGRLDRTMGGPDLPTASADEGTRRSIYYRYARGSRDKLLTMFDAAGIEECYRRRETVVPQQALALANGKAALAGAEAIATALGREAGVVEDGAFAVAAFVRVLGREPTEAERAECVAGLRELAGPDPAGKARARVALVHVLINHDDFVAIR